MIAVLADQHVSQQAGTGQPLGDRPLRRDRLMDRAARSAAILGTTDADDPQAGWYPVEHLAHRLADRMQGAATARTGLRPEIEVHVLALQRIGKAGTVRSTGRRLFGRGNHRQEFFDTGDVGAEIFQAELQLAVLETLGAPAELQTLQLLHDQPQALDLALGLGQRGPFARAFRRQLADQPMQRINIIRQGSKIDVHGSQGYACSR